MTGSSRRLSPHPNSHQRAIPEYCACTEGVMAINRTGPFQVGAIRARKWELSLYRTGDKLFTGRLCQGSVHGMQAMRSGSLAVKSHQRRLHWSQRCEAKLIHKEMSSWQPQCDQQNFFSIHGPVD